MAEKCSLNDSLALFRSYRPNADDEATMGKIFAHVQQHNQDVRILAEARRNQRKIEAKLFHTNHLSQSDQKVFHSIIVHPLTSNVTKDGLQHKISIGWEASRIKPAIPHFFDANLAQDLSEFADSQVTISFYGLKTTYADSEDSITIERQREESLPGIAHQTAFRKVLDTFPILNNIVNLADIISIIPRKPTTAHQWHERWLPSSATRFTVIGKNWPIPETFSTEDKIKRFGCVRYYVEHMVGEKLSHWPTGWNLTPVGVDYVVENIKLQGVYWMKKLVEEDKECINKMCVDVRWCKWSRYAIPSDYQDEKGMNILSKMKKEIKEESELRRIEGKYGVKRTLDAEEKKKAKVKCAICDRKMNPGQWLKHISTKTHMNKTRKKEKSLKKRKSTEDKARPKKKRRTLDTDSESESLDPL